MKIIVANWKMNGDLDFATKFIEEINSVSTRNTVVVCPPTALIYKFRDFRYYVGGQNCFYKRNGAFTGENSPQLLKEMGCRYVIIGHSERRHIFNETDDVIFKKWEISVEQDLIPIVCVGEKDRANWRQAISNQLGSFLGKPLQNTIFAYEPVWSIGTGLIPSYEEIDIVLSFMRDVLQGCKTLLLYGGSVNSKNVKQILNCRNINGVLVGGSSLDIDEFKKIILN